MAVDDKNTEKESEIDQKTSNCLNEEHDISGDWNDNIKWNLNSFLNINEEPKTTWKSRNVYSMPNSKFQAYCQNRFPNSVISKILRLFINQKIILNVAIKINYVFWF